MAVEKMLPHNIEAETSVLGSLLIEPEAILQIADFLRADDFYRDSHRQIFQAALELFERRQPADLVTLCDELASRDRLEDVGGASYITSLINAVPTSAHIEFYGRIVERTSLLRRLIHAAGQIAAIAFNETDAGQALDKSEQIIFHLAQRHTRDDFVHLKTLLGDYMNKIDHIHASRGAIVGLPTGFTQLDSYTGGLQRSDLIILAARPSVGKTALALSLAYNAAMKEKKIIGIFSLEMSKEQIAQRFISMEAGVDSRRLRTGFIEEAELARVVEACGALAEANIFIDDTAGISIMEMRSRARRLHAEQKLDMIIVDYLQLMQGGQSNNRVNEISEISRALKGLARELDVPVLALSQLSRAVETRQSKVPQLSDLRESGCLAGDTLLTRADTGEQVAIRDLARGAVSADQPIPVLSLTANRKLRVTPMTRVFSSGRKLIYELTTVSGRKIKASANHPFLTMEGWKRLDHLAVGVSVAIPRCLPSLPGQPRLMDEDSLTLLGNIIGEGSYVRRLPMLHYADDTENNMATVAIAANRAAGIQAKLVQQENWFHVCGHELEQRCHNPLAKWPDSRGSYEPAVKEKLIPTLVYRMPPGQLATFLRNLWASNGCLSFGAVGVGRRCLLYYATGSRQLAAQIQHLLLRVGVNGRIKHRRGNYERGWAVDIAGRENQLRFFRSVLVHGLKSKLVQEAGEILARIKATSKNEALPAESWRLVQEAMGRAQELQAVSAEEVRSKVAAICRLATPPGAGACPTPGAKARPPHGQSASPGLTRAQLTQVATCLPDSELAALVRSDIYWDPITAITSLGIEDVYDATVPETHNFIANDFIVHNSIEQDADIVLFIYRDEIYNPETDRKNVADIYIAKHRNGPVGQISLHFQPGQTRFRDLELTPGAQ